MARGFFFGRGQNLIVKWPMKVIAAMPFENSTPTILIAVAQKLSEP
jgi:hypothetical protein